MANRIEEEIKKTVKILQEGGVILYPTDTIWGLGCDATNEKAVTRIYEIKKRTDTKAMLILVDDTSKILNYVEEVPEMAWQLVELTTKPLTIIYPKAKNLPYNLVAENGSIGIRVTDEEFSKKLCAQFGKPIVSTSANISGKATPLNFSEISDEIKSAVDYIVKYRQKETLEAKPSSIIKIEKGNIIQIIRQ